MLQDEVHPKTTVAFVQAIFDFVKAGPLAGHESTTVKGHCVYTPEAEIDNYKTRRNHITQLKVCLEQL